MESPWNLVDRKNEGSQRPHFVILCKGTTPENGNLTGTAMSPEETVLRTVPSACVLIEGKRHRHVT